MIEAVRNEEINMGLISNPNNPTGNLLLDETGVKNLLSGTPGCLWVIDEAYADYADVSFIPLIGEFSNLIVLRTFSKAYGLAGMRIGYAVASEPVAARLAQIRLPWSVNQMSLVAAEAAFSDQDYLQKTIAKIKTDCRNLLAEFEEFTFLRAFESAANFFLLEIKNTDPKRLKAFLNERGIRVRARTDMPQFIRVTSLLPVENARLISALREFAHMKMI